MQAQLFQLSIVSRYVPKIRLNKQIVNIIFLSQSVYVTLMGQLLWTVMKTMAIALAKRDLQELNVMNVCQMLLVTNVTHVNQASLVIPFV